MLAVDAVAEVDPAAITEDDARAAGFRSLAELRRRLDRHGDAGLAGDFHHAVPTRGGAAPTTRPARRRAGQAAGASGPARPGRPRRPWTIVTLRLIGDQPGVRAGDLAASAGRERHPFKIDVRKLKELG